MRKIGGIADQEWPCRVEENALLSKWDELMCHQLPTTMDHVHTDSSEWTERIYVNIYNVCDEDTIIGFGVRQIAE
jgi:hypothetical protein